MILKLTSNAPGATTFTLVDDGVTATGYDLLAGSSFGSAVWDHQFSGPRGTQGARPSQGRLSNREVTLILRVSGASKDAVAGNLSDIADAVDDLRRFGGTLRWRSRSQTRYQNADILTAVLDLPTWDNRLEQINRAVVQVRLACGPYMLGDPMDVSDPFTTDNVNGGEVNYTADAGALTNLVVTGGALTASANLTTEDRLIYTGTGYGYGDTEAQVFLTPGTTITSLKAGVILKRVDASNYLECYVDDNGANSRIRVDKVVAGARTNLATTNLAARMVAGQRIGIRGRIEQNTVTAGAFVSKAMRFIDSATTEAAITLTTAEAAVLGIPIEGKAGLTFTPQHASALLDDFTVRPFTYRAPDQGQTMLRGAIPGDATAPADLWVSSPGGAVTYAFGLIGWQARTNWNRIQNGGFDIGVTTAQWQVTAVAGITGAASSIATSATSPKFGAVCGSVSTPATANVGTTIPLYQRFVAGVTYTFEVWVRSPASTTLVRARFGVSGDVSSSTAVALSTTWTRHTVAWTPTATVDLAYVCIEQTAATASTIEVDGAIAYDGTTTPTHGRHGQGVGGYPPLVQISGADFISKSANLTIGLIGSDWAITDSSVLAGGETYEARYAIDPSLGKADDYTDGDMGLDVWATVYLSSDFTGGVTIIPSALSLSEDIPIYTSEYGSVGYSPPVAGLAAVSAMTLQRLGRLNLGARDHLPWVLRLAATVAAGTNLRGFGFGNLFLVPSRARASSPTGTGTSYPKFIPGVSTQLKIIRSADLSGFYSTTIENVASGRSSGLLGAPIELPPGNVDAMFLLSRGTPNSSSPNDLTAAAAPFHLAVTPRWHWLRDA